MLFNILLIFLVVYIVVLPFITIRIIKFGLKVAVKPKEAVSEPIFNVKAYKKAPKLSPEDKRRIAIMQNVEAFDGTGFGQKEIKNAK